MSDPETPRPDLPFQGPAATADHRPVPPLAARFGLPVAVASLVATVAIVLWASIGPTAVAGELVDAPFTIDATLLLGPDDAGCVRLVDGAGATVTHCPAELADALREGDGDASVWFDPAGDVVVSVWDGDPVWLTLDPDTGEVLERGVRGNEPERREPPEPTGEPLDDRVSVRGDQVVVFGPYGEDDDEVLLDLEAPPGRPLTNAALSPDDRWVVAVTSRGQVVVAPADGSEPPYVWATSVGDDRWVDVRSQVRWAGA